MKIVIGSDHGGFELKEKVKKLLSKHKCVDVGTCSTESCDYPDFALQVAEKVSAGNSIGIIICSSGVGVSIVANKVKGIRAALCHNVFTATKAREHVDANVLCLGQSVVGDATEIVKAFIDTKFSGEERHVRRVGMIKEIEKRYMK